jgi:hypothetical protein
MWQNFQQAGAKRLILCRVLEHRTLLAHIAEAVPGATITVVRLHASQNELGSRIRAREAGRDLQWYLDAAAYLMDQMQTAHVEDHLVSNQNRTAAGTRVQAVILACPPGRLQRLTPRSVLAGQRAAAGPARESSGPGLSGSRTRNRVSPGTDSTDRSP